MIPPEERLIGELPRAWSDRLFAGVLSGNAEALWQATARIVLEVLPDDVVVIWQTFDSIAFSAAANSLPSFWRSSEAYALRAPAIYTAANLEYQNSVRAFDEAALASAGLLDFELVRMLRPLHAVSLDFLHDTEIDASLCIYGRDRHAPLRQRTLESLSQCLSLCVSALRERQRAVAAGTGLADFLRDVPVGLILVDWFGAVLTVNDEGCRHAAIWNDAPARPSVKAARQRFSVPVDLQQGWDGLRAGWIDWLRGYGARPDPALIHHQLENGLSAVIELVYDRDAPTAAPCFMARFYNMHIRGEQAPVTFSSGQVAILSQLSPAERTVAVMVQAGHSNGEIAEHLGRQVGTVKDHLTSIYLKLGVSRRAQLIKLLHTADSSLIPSPAPPLPKTVHGA